MTKAQKPESFEDSLAALEELVRELEGGDKGLEESLALFEKGVVLAKELTKRLEEAKTKVEALAADGGKLVKKPFAPKEE
ncbi:MAG TPA: exodeoxyribonuclease VII small subunit [Elusimicrobiota bacterium]|jgi:exodeoxyribonuclease VII small subunit|nr:exodeoxyribonuclease VII small subunit [Elusimicrobiota bacterium]